MRNSVSRIPQERAERKSINHGKRHGKNVRGEKREKEAIKRKVERKESNEWINTEICKMKRRMTKK